MPITTYRLQLHNGFTLSDAREVAPYLAALGVTDCYVSPIFTSTPGSTHGYDVCRHDEINPELGGEAALQSFSAELTRLGMGLVLDFVPNHMSNDARTNQWWRSVLENGPSSSFAEYFDIDWHPVKPELHDRLLLPILGEQYGEALERGALVLRFDAGILRLHYGDLVLPINPRRFPLVLELGIDALEQELGADSATMREFLSILTALRNLPAYTERDPGKIAERQRETQVAADRLHRLAETEPAIQHHIERAVTAVNGTPGDARSMDRLHELLELQAYRLASWRTAADEINYRRFFDINELAALRVEDAKVFDDVHGLVLRLVETGVATGLRLDHIDGLFDPRGYLERLAHALGDRRDRVYVVVEKILSAGEALRTEWKTAGTTGYTFLNDVNGVFVDGRHAKKVQRIYAKFTGRQDTFADVAYEAKRLIVSTALSSEFQVLTQAVNRLSESDRRCRDFTLASIRRALREVVACCPVYRTYVSPAGVSDADAAALDSAIADARRRNPALESSIFDFLRSVLLPSLPAQGKDEGADSRERARFDVAMRFQQYTSPVQAKGVEDTAFYRFHPLVSLNEVGGNPSRFGRTVADFHVANVERRRLWPREMLATTTHDTKRSEDARARLNVLSELPDAWQTAVSRWRRVNASRRTRLATGHAPDANDEYLCYQALVGVWPAEPAATPIPQRADAELVTRVQTYMAKAVKEAKLHTSWITPNAAYEAALHTFIERVLTGRTAPAFLASFVPFARRVAAVGMVNSLAQLVLKIASPGVPDFYQGTELWDLSLVDPDNRRPVNWADRRRILESLEPWLALASPDAAPTSATTPALGEHVTELLHRWEDGHIKAFVTACGMRLRRSHSSVFLDGAYEALPAEGAAASHVVAFARQTERETLVCVVPRLSAALCAGGSSLPIGDAAWGDTRVMLPARLAGRSFRNLLTGRRLVAAQGADTGDGTVAWQMRDVLDTCPVALMWADPTA